MKLVRASLRHVSKHAYILQYLKKLMSIQIPLQVNTQSYTYIYVCRWIKFDCTPWEWNETVIHTYVLHQTPSPRITFMHHGHRGTFTCKASSNTLMYTVCTNTYQTTSKYIHATLKNLCSLTQAIWKQCCMDCILHFFGYESSQGYKF